MRHRLVLALIAGASWLALPQEIAAQGGPPVLFGVADFEMEWQLSPQGTSLRVAYLASKRRLRIEALDGSDQVMIRDLASGKVAVLVANGAKGAFGIVAKPLGGFQPSSIGDLREVAGNRCRDFVHEGRKLCVTDDGIPVEVDLGAQRLTATRVIRQTQVPALFEVPKGITLKAPPGATAGALPGLPF